jgi:hypothetical protein
MTPSVAGVLASALLTFTAADLAAQTVDDPIIPRGTVFLRVDASATNVDGTYGPDETLPLGSAFDGHLLGSAELTTLIPVAERFRALAGEAEPRVLTIGTTEARFLADERSVPLQLAYGLLDRLTLAVTVPLVRKRVETSLGLSPEGANVGRSPLASDPTEVSAFRNGGATALAATTTAVNAHCTTAGEQDPQCIAGRALIAETGTFLDNIGEAYDTEAFFPSLGSELGNGIAGKWQALEAQLAPWGVDGPESVPLATEGVTQASFESLAVRPAWPLPGFPLETPPVHLGLGDVEVSAALGLLRPSPPSPTGDRDGIALAASVVASARFATGSADSLRAVAPTEPPRGVAGFTVRAVTDLLLPRRISVLGTVEAGSSGSRTMTFLAATPDSVLTPGWSRARARWSPGSHLRLSVTPRFRFGPGLSLGVGWHFYRRGADEIEPVGTQQAPIGTFGDEAATQHRLAVELRYAAVEQPNIDSVPFPFEILLRGSQSFAGSGGAPAEARAEVMVRAQIHPRD